MEPEGRLMVDFDRLLTLRVVVARHGEMDCARWWNTQGMLSRYGGVALRRGLPRTHQFAQARVVIAVARSRCRELFSADGCATLWELPAAVEEQFESRWGGWLERADEWSSLYARLQSYAGDDLLGLMGELELVSRAEAETVQGLRRSAEGRVVQLPGVRRLDDPVVTLLAAAYAKGEPEAPAVPYVRLEE